MKTIAFFNNRKGVGKTTLVYHLAWMYAELGLRVFAADLDPQAGLSAMALDDDNLSILEDERIINIYDFMNGIIADGREIRPEIVELRDGLGLLVGDLRLSRFEDDMSVAWQHCIADFCLERERAFRITTGLAKAVQRGAKHFYADITLIDMGPNLGAINRCALLGADSIVVPVAPGLFSIKGLSSLRSGLIKWKREWNLRLKDAPPAPQPWHRGKMQPIGYVVSRSSSDLVFSPADFHRWIDHVPSAYHKKKYSSTKPIPQDINSDSACLASMKYYWSLVAMAKEAKKPMFLLKPADGAIGAHQTAVKSAYADFRALAGAIARAADIALPDHSRTSG